jgi:hypothetical protein
LRNHSRRLNFGIPAIRLPSFFPGKTTFNPPFAHYSQPKK